MAHAAIGFAKQHLRRKIYACSSSVGPGAANMLTAAATATANRIPLLLLPGDVYALPPAGPGAATDRAVPRPEHQHQRCVQGREQILGPASTVPSS